MSKNYYPEMMDLINEKTPDNVTVLDVYRWLQKHRPHSIIQAIKAIESENKPASLEPIYDECRMLIKADKYIAAIKHLREQTGIQLKPAKDIIDNLRAEMNSKEEPTYYQTCRDIRDAGMIEKAVRLWMAKTGNYSSVDATEAVKSL